MIINKSQGQSVNHVGLDLRSPVTCVTHGQFYVGILRVTSWENIKAIWDDEEEIKAKTKNIVSSKCY